MSKRWRVTIIFSIFVITITAWQAANWYRTTRAIQELFDIVEEESESKVQEGVLEKEGLPAEHEKFLAEHSAAVMLHIPHIVDYLNSLSADEQHAFFKQVKATLRAVALEHGETNLEILDKSVELFVNQLLEAGFEPRY